MSGVLNDKNKRRTTMNIYFTDDYGVIRHIDSVETWYDSEDKNAVAETSYGNSYIFEMTVQEFTSAIKYSMNTNSMDLRQFKSQFYEETASE